jgi:hypothetical protein
MLVVKVQPNVVAVHQANMGPHRAYQYVYNVVPDTTPMLEQYLVQHVLRVNMQVLDLVHVLLVLLAHHNQIQHKHLVINVSQAISALLLWHLAQQTAIVELVLKANTVRVLVVVAVQFAPRGM